MNGNQSLEISPIKSDRAESKFGKNVKPRKVYVQARYKEKVNRPTISYSFTREMNRSGGIKENILIGNANLANKNHIVDTNKKPLAVTVRPPEKSFIRPANPARNKLSKEKCLQKDSIHSSKDETGKKKLNQSSLDMAYCQYLQSAFLANHFTAAIGTQKCKFSEEFQLLDKEERRATETLNTLNAYKGANDLIKRKNFAVDNLMSSLDTLGCLESLCRDLESSANLVEVDSGLELDSPEVPGELLLIGKYLQIQQEVAADWLNIIIDGDFQVIEPAHIEHLAQLEGNLVAVRQSMAQQAYQIDSLKDLALSICTKIVSNVPIGDFT